MSRYLCSICLLAIGCALAFAAALPGETAAPASDLLILRSGAIEKGELKSYSDNHCQLDEKSFSRDQIAWIGFSTAIAKPPAITDPTHDEVHLRDGTVQTGRLVSVSLTQVVTEKKSYNRTEIAWIYLAIEQGGKTEGAQPSASPSASPPAAPPGGFAGLWTIKGHVTQPQDEWSYTIEAVFTFTFSRYTNAVECGTASQPYCGSATVTIGPGRAKDCTWARTPPVVRGVKIRVNGIRKGNELIYLTFHKIENVPGSYHWDCTKFQYDEQSDLTASFGSLLPEGITIALPVTGHTTVDKHESGAGGTAQHDHHVEIYAPR